MTKRILAVLLTLAMVLSICSVNMFAVDATGSYKGTTLDSNTTIELPGSLAGLKHGDTVKIQVKGTSDNEAVRVYLSNATDAGRVTEVFTIPVTDGAFSATQEFTIVADGSVQGTAAPTHVFIKGKDYADNLKNAVIEVLDISVVKNEEPEEDESEEPEYVYEDTLIYNVETLPDTNGVKAPIADGVALTGSGGWGTKAFLDWTNGNGSFASALQQPNAYVKIVLKAGGSVTDVNIQSYLGLVEGTDYGHLYNHTNVGEAEVLEDGRVVYYVEAAAIVSGYVKSISTHITNNADKEYKDGVAAIGSFGNLLIGGEGTVVSLSVVSHIKKEVVKPVEKTGRTFGFAIQLTNHMHGFLVNGKMIPMAHRAVGDVCPQCGQKLADSTWTYVRPSGKTNHDK